MSWNQFREKWRQYKAAAIGQLGRIISNDLNRAEGVRGQFTGRIHECYGIIKDAADHEVKERSWGQPDARGVTFSGRAQPC